MAKPLFHGVCASSITPFGQQGALDLARLGPHLDWLIGEGVDAISPLGSSGEFVAMECEGAHWFSTMKAGLNMIGPPVGDPEPPIAPLPASLRETLAQLLRDLGYKVQS